MKNETNKINYSLFVFTFLLITRTHGFSQSDFIVKWTFQDIRTTISFYALTTGDVDYTWSTSPSGNSGSGTFSQLTPDVVTLSGLIINIGDEVTVTMEPANLRRFYHGDYTDFFEFSDVAQWGDVPWSSMENAFSGCNIMNISATDVPDLSGVTSMAYMFYSCWILNSPANIGTWDVSNVTLMNNLFDGCYLFNQDIGGWDVTNVTNMEAMFKSCNSFDQDIGGWDVFNVTNMREMFYDCIVFDQDIGGWDVSGVTDMEGMFRYCIKFNQNIGGWDVSNVTVMTDMFYQCVVFNQDIGGWVVSDVTDMAGMFYEAFEFNQYIGSWDVSGVTDMTAMFNNADKFNQDIGGWDVSNVISMAQMFAGADSFNQDISGWDVSGVSFFNSMFQEAPAFNQDISGWDISGAYDFWYMFYEATAFDQNLGAWDLPPNIDLGNMFENSGLSCVNYSLTLAGWANNPSTPSNLTLVANGMEYSPDVVPERNYLIGTKSWTILGDNQGSCQILPVTLLSFKVTLDKNKASIQWQTASEKSNAGFEVQQSADGIQWTALDFVHSKAKDGNSYSPLKYNIFDADLNPGTNYYRLKQVDLSNSYTYSEVRSLHYNGTLEQDVYPNPATDRIYFPVSAGQVAYKVYDSKGKVVLEDDNYSKQFVEIGHLPAGMYMIHWAVSDDYTPNKDKIIVLD